MKTDFEIQKDVQDELNWEPMLNAAQIGVTSKNGVVTLTGTVNTYAKKIAAEKAAQRVAGVKAVAEDIEVRPTSIGAKNDTEIAEAILSALKWNSTIREEKVKVKVDDGWVTLSGEVEWEFEKSNIQSAVGSLMGVRGVTNTIAIKPKTSPLEIKRKITSAFGRRASLDANNIEIETIGSSVILRGQVHSWLEKQDAENAAWAAPGVETVQNNLEISGVVTAVS